MKFQTERSLEWSRGHNSDFNVVKKLRNAMIMFNDTGKEQS